MAASFSCTQCKATFGRLPHLRRHQKTHCGEKPYVCQYCPIASSRKDVIVRHTKNFHRDEMQSARIPQSSIPDHSNGSSQGHPPPQPDLQLVGLDNVALDYMVELDLYNFRAHEFSETELNSLTATKPLQSPRNTFIGNVLSDDQTHYPPIVNPSPTHSWNAFCDEAGYANARANLALYDLSRTLSDFRFPSQHAFRRSVHAFFKHMAPHMPIVHKPTFNIASVPSPLLIEIAACGALYLGEHITAASMNAAAQQLIFQVTQHESYSKDGKFQLWMLQTYLLMSCFGAYGGDLAVQERSANVFPYALKLTQDALKELDACPALTYEDWVYRETISRCVASTVEIGAGLASTDQCLTVPFLDASFPLPSHMAAWQEDGISWPGYSQQENSTQILNMIFSGQQPTSSVSEYGLVSLVSMLLWRVCSFKSLTNTHHLDQYTEFVEKIERAIEVFDSMLQDQNTGELPSPLLQSARSQLYTAVYHLYGSKALTEMKRLVESPEKAILSGSIFSPKLHLALIRAAEALESDCQLGMCYLRRMAAHHFSPVCAIACYEGGLLLAWYLMVKPFLSSGLALNAKLDKLIENALAETAGMRETYHGQHSKLPLVIVAYLLSNRSVWQWPYSISEKLKDLIQSSREIPFQGTPYIETNDIAHDTHVRRQSETSG